MGHAEGPPPLRYLSVGELVGGAGGDPWQLNASLQSGEPGEIAGLAESFFTAAGCTLQTNDDFNAAKLRFERAWNRDTADNPINASQEVQRATAQMHLQHLQLHSIGSDMEGIAASLAEAQAVAAPMISGLNAVLMSTDAQIGVALANGAKQADIDALRQSAVHATAGTLRDVQGVRDGYSASLADGVTRLRGLDGYDPLVLQGVDADGNRTPWQNAQAAAQQYDTSQRAADEALVKGGDPQSQAVRDAQGRLRDWTTVNNPYADPSARMYAGERLEDYNTVRQGQPTLTDPILGQDAFTRAQTRLEWQRRLEQGMPDMGTVGRTPDQVTALLDDSEEKAKVMVTNRTITELERQGMTPAGALSTVDQLSRGITWEQLAKATGKVADPAGMGLERSSAAESFGRHNLEIANPDDIEVLEKLGKRVGAAGNLISVGLALDDIYNGKPVGETLAKTGGEIGGGWAGGMALGAAGGMWVGPEGALIGGIIGSIVGSIGGGEGANAIYKWATG